VYWSLQKLIKLCFPDVKVVVDEQEEAETARSLKKS